MTQLLADMLKNLRMPGFSMPAAPISGTSLNPSGKSILTTCWEFKDRRPYNSYKMYGDSKMALLMLTFKMAEQFKQDGIKVNMVQIPAIKLSPETVAQFKSGWSIAARVQNLFSAPPETMADTYFHICTSEEFKDVTGKLINDQREIMQSSHYTSGFVEELKQLRDQRVYPRYADKADNIERVWDLAVALTDSLVGV